jgi:uncharacterized protein (TIGR02453 family)
MAEFKGFPKDFFAFLDDLKVNNDRPWFNDNKGRYYESVVNPVSEFIVCMGPRLRAISRHYVADPRPHGGSMFRIYRDTRFSKDKSPYKTHVGVQFRHEAGKDAHAPGFYVHLALDGLFFGGGVWRPPGPVLGRIRDHIVDNPRAWGRISKSAKVLDAGGLKGDSLVRPPRGFDADHVHIEDLKRKSFYVTMEAPSQRALLAEILDDVTEAFRRAAPLNRFITGALELPF